MHSYQRRASQRNATVPTKILFQGQSHDSLKLPAVTTYAHCAYVLTAGSLRKAQEAPKRAKLDTALITVRRVHLRKWARLCFQARNENIRNFQHEIKRLNVANIPLISPVYHVFRIYEKKAQAASLEISFHILLVRKEFACCNKNRFLANGKEQQKLYCTVC